MADFAGVLRRAVEALKDNTPEARETIYNKARATIEAKLASAPTPPSPELVAHQKGQLEEAIAKVEAEYAPAETPQEPEDELESLLAELNRSTIHNADVAVEAQGSAPRGGEMSDPVLAEPEAGAVPVVEEPELHEETSEDGGWREDAEDPAAIPAQDFHETSDWRDEDPVLAEEASPAEDGLPQRPAAVQPARRGFGWVVPLLVLLLIVVGLGVGGWLYRDNLAQVAGFDSFGDVVAFAGGGSSEEPEEGAGQRDEGSGEQTEGSASEADASASPEQQQKFTQRLLPDGSEVDPGPADGNPGLGEGRSVAAATRSDAAPAQQADEGTSVGQSAIFYEERTSVAEGSANNGSVVWSITQESPGDNLPPEPTIHAEATIPERGVQLRLTIRRNVDQSLPASHIVELIFLTPENFPGGGVNQVLRMAMKRNEQDTGSPLLGIPAKIADGFFLIALSDNPADVETNSTLLRRESWIDIPLVYSSGRRALITLEKGAPGNRIFQEALEAWGSASSG